MKIHHSFARGPGRPLVVAIGFFDGVHRGHRELIRRTLLARKPGWRTGALTFSNHPSAYLRPGQEPALLQTCDERINMLSRLGIEECFLVPFDREIASLSAEKFIDDVLLGELAVRAVITGTTFRFGEKRTGDVALLRERLAAHGAEHIGVEAVCDREEGARISSTRIRTLIADGDCVRADALLGASYELRGSVVRGFGRGHDLGFPTANLRIEPKMLPPDGVYAATARFDGRDYTALLSIGTNPQFGENERSVEVWLRDFQGSLYGEQIAVRDLRFVRAQQTFIDTDALMRQMERDREAVAFPSYG